jgi:hypothetical protein
LALSVYCSYMLAFSLQAPSSYWDTPTSFVRQAKGQALYVFCSVFLAYDAVLAPHSLVIMYLRRHLSRQRPRRTNPRRKETALRHPKQRRRSSWKMTTSFLTRKSNVWRSIFSVCLLCLLPHSVWTVSEKKNGFQFITKSTYACMHGPSHALADVIVERQKHKVTEDTVTTCECVFWPGMRENSGCMQDCLNRYLLLQCLVALTCVLYCSRLFFECHPTYCRLGNRCSNQQFMKRQYARMHRIKVTLLCSCSGTNNLADGKKGVWHDSC